MARFRQAFGALAATIRFLTSCIRYVQRRRMKDSQRPHLRLDFIHPPSWGAEKLDFAISNTGGSTARNCRYCRLQEFTMIGSVGRPPSFSARRWYSSDRLSVPAGGRVRSSASLTMSRCPQGILGDVAVGGGDETTYQDAIVCQDSAGIVYRFLCYLGPDAPPDVWSAGLLDRFRAISPPAWAEWAVSTAAVERAHWSNVK